MSIIIEKAARSDAKELLEFLKQVGGETDNLTFGAEGVPFTVREEEEFLAGQENSKDNVMFVAKDNGKIVGNASLNRFPRRMSHRGDFGICVLKDYWNKGIGSQLLGAIIDFAKENSFEIIELHVRFDNINAIRLYEKFGFKKIGTHPKFHKVNGEYINYDLMSLELM